MIGTIVAVGVLALTLAVLHGTPRRRGRRGPARRRQIIASTFADLDLMRRPPELHAGATVLSMIIGALAGPLVWSAVPLAAGRPVTAAAPAWFLVIGAGAGGAHPTVRLRRRCETVWRRRCAAFAAYLDVLVVVLAGVDDVDEASALAAGTAIGAAGDEVLDARRPGEPLWIAVERVGERLLGRDGPGPETPVVLRGDACPQASGDLVTRARLLRSRARAAGSDAARRSRSSLLLLAIASTLVAVAPDLAHVPLRGV